MKFFADDVASYVCSVQSVTDCNTFQRNCSLVLQWQIHLNLSKCELLCISNKRSPLYYINNHNLQFRFFLSITIHHRTTISRMFLLKLPKFQTFCTVTCAPAILPPFRELVIPVLDYASVVWNPHTHKIFLH